MKEQLSQKIEDRAGLDSNFVDKAKEPFVLASVEEKQGNGQTHAAAFTFAVSASTGAAGAYSARARIHSFVVDSVGARVLTGLAWFRSTCFEVVTS